MRCNQLFKASDNLLKQKILRTLLSNVEMYDKTLSYTVINPYEAFIQLNRNYKNDSKNSEWCSKTGVTQTITTLIDSATKFQDDYAFQELVEELELSGELFAV